MKKSGLDYAFFLLSRRDYPCEVLKTKLHSKGYPDEEIEETLNKLIDYKYIDDEVYAKNFIKNRKSQGRLKTKFELIRKGIDKNKLEDIFSNMPDDEFENALILARKKANLLFKKYDNKQVVHSSLYRYLIGKGFTIEVYNRCIKNIDENFCMEIE